MDAMLTSTELMREALNDCFHTNNSGVLSIRMCRIHHSHCVLTTPSVCVNYIKGAGVLNTPEWLYMFFTCETPCLDLQALHVSQCYAPSTFPLILQRCIFDVEKQVQHGTFILYTKGCCIISTWPVWTMHILCSAHHWYQCGSSCSKPHALGSLTRRMY
jgi:hypothetical protein